MATIKEFYKSLKKDKNNELSKLFQKPKPETGINMPVAQVFNKNVYYQADLLYMPEDAGFKYILVCVDMYDGTIDAEPLKNREQKDIIKAFTEIFKRKYLEFPYFIIFDKGSEFGKEVKKYFTDKQTNVKYALTGRHRMLANVERANQKIGTILFKRMASQELLTGEENNNWKGDLKDLIEVLNENKKKPLAKEISPYPLIDSYNGKLLKIGQKVRLLLDYPINNTSKKRLYGNFRSSDIRWSPEIYKVTEVLLKPGFPPFYLTDANDDIARTKNQLAIVEKNEKAPQPKFIRDEPEYYIVEKILDKKIENRKTFYLTKWKGYPTDQSTWEPSEVFDRTKQLKDLKQQFNSR